MKQFFNTLPISLRGVLVLQAILNLVALFNTPLIHLSYGIPFALYAIVIQYKYDRNFFKLIYVGIINTIFWSVAVLIMFLKLQKNGRI